MDTYSSRVIAPKAPFDSEAAAKDEAISSRARISVEGYEFNKDTENEIRIQLVNHFKSCGYVSRVDFPPEPLLDSRAFVTIFGDGAKEKALQLNGSDMGGWNALVKFAPEEEDEEYQAESDYTDFVMNELLNDKRLQIFKPIHVFALETLLDTIPEAAPQANFLDAGKASGRRRRVLHSVTCFDLVSPFSIVVFNIWVCVFAAPTALSSPLLRLCLAGVSHNRPSDSFPGRRLSYAFQFWLYHHSPLQTNS
ncbi:hypothetical protein F2Q70_00028143 [Brassica cretica]|uniref:RRM domain-containing protein n=1 Tax=Brassica cretica TaxID=69181 RepID=A0A8S9L7Q2_BRACR|nr:hypothetical protein F2Q70_00028143 [Brassica cretica]